MQVKSIDFFLKKPNNIYFLLWFSNSFEFKHFLFVDHTYFFKLEGIILIVVILYLMARKGEVTDYYCRIQSVFFLKWWWAEHMTRWEWGKVWVSRLVRISLSRKFSKVTQVMTQAFIYLEEKPHFHIFFLNRRMTVRLGPQTDSFLEMGHDN